MKELSVFPTGEKNTAYAKYFIGQSYLYPLSTEQVHISNVTFEPGCRNNWHVHTAKKGGGQIHLHRRRRMVPGMGPAGKKTETGRCRQYPDRRETLARRHERQLVPAHRHRSAGRRMRQRMARTCI